MAAPQKPLPATKDGYRYSWGADDVMCKGYIEQLNRVEAANKRINQPAFIKSKLLPDTVRLSENDKATQLKLNEDNTIVTGEKGYSMVRATHGINRGKFYFEARIDSMPDNTATRIGWTQYYSNLQAPLGYDHYGYSWRSRFGTKFHQARGKSFDKSGGYGKGDVIGCMIELPFEDGKQWTRAHHLPKSVKSTGLVVRSKKGVPTMLEERDNLPTLNTMTIHPGSRISFYKNGYLVGLAYEDIFAGFYYPAISLYKSCIVSVNFGPRFMFPPEKYNHSTKLHIHYQPASSMALIAAIDNLLADLLYVIEQELSPEGNKLEDIVKKAVLGHG